MDSKTAAELTTWLAQYGNPAYASPSSDGREPSVANRYLYGRRWGLAGAPASVAYEAAKVPAMMGDPITQAVSRLGISTIGPAVESVAYDLLNPDRWMARNYTPADVPSRALDAVRVQARLRPRGQGRWNIGEGTYPPSLENVVAYLRGAFDR